MNQIMRANVINIEKELEELKRRLAKKDKEINEVDIDRLKYIEEEFRMVLPE